MCSLKFNVWLLCPDRSFAVVIFSMTVYSFVAFAQSDNQLPQPYANITDIVAGHGASSCAIVSGGVKCWGYNNRGQIGDGTFKDKSVPTSVLGLSRDISSIAVGGNYACAVQNGAVKCWGTNTHGQLGVNMIQSSSSPVQIIGLSSSVTHIVASDGHICAMVDSGVKCWGDNEFGQLGDGAELTSGVTRIRRKASPTSVLDLSRDVTMIDVSSSHSCAIQDGAAKCWGANSSSQLGDRTTFNRSRPVQVLGLESGVTALATGDRSTCAIHNKAAKCWGKNHFGQLGDGTFENKSSPVSVRGLNTNVEALSVGNSHACVMQNGAMKCWGKNTCKKLGVGSAEDEINSPLPVLGLNGEVNAFTVGGLSTCAIHNNVAECWGCGFNGGLGDGKFTERGVPSPLYLHSIAPRYNTKHDADRVIFDVVFSEQVFNVDQQDFILTTVYGDVNGEIIAVEGDGAFYAVTVTNLQGEGSLRLDLLGRSYEDAQGNPGQPFVNGKEYLRTVTFGLGLTLIDIDVGSHGCAVISGGAKCWGTNNVGQLGDGTQIDKYVPVSVDGLYRDVTQISVGALHSCAIHNGAVKCWGAGGSGQLGDSTMSDSLTPVQIANLSKGVSDISVGDSYTCVVQYGAARCWGENAAGQLGDGTQQDKFSPESVVGLDKGVTAIAAGFQHSCAVQQGAAKCWGAGNSGQLGNGTFESSTQSVQVVGLEDGVTAISVQSDHTCAVYYGAVKCWGAGDFGQLGDGRSEDSSSPVQALGLVDNVTSISVGVHHACAVRSRILSCWGLNDFGQIGDSTIVNRAVPTEVPGFSPSVITVSAGNGYTCANQSDGIKCWGAGDSGRLGDGRGLSSVFPVDVYLHPIAPQYGTAEDSDTVVFDVVFTEPVSGVSTESFILNFSNEFTTGRISQVSGSGALYELTVVDVAGVGVLNLDVLEATYFDQSRNPGERFSQGIGHSVDTFRQLVKRSIGATASSQADFHW